MKIHLLLFLSLLFVSCSTLKTDRLSRQPDKHKHIVSVLNLYPHAILVGGLDTDVATQIARYYQTKDSTSNETSNNFTGLTIHRDSLTGELEGATITSGVLFGFDSYELGADQQPIIDTFIEALRSNGIEKSVYIIGHTDSTGSNSYNHILSEHRANSVKSYIEAKYLGEVEVVSAFGLGETKPIASNETEAGRQQNRRVEIIIKN